MKLSKIKKILSNKNYLFGGIVKKLSPFIKNDRTYLSLRYKALFGHKLNWENPQSFSEKMQWLKVYNRKPHYTIMADKIKAKDWVADKIGSEYIIPTLGTWERAEDVDFDILPDKFVIKCNHNSGTGMYICTDKNNMDVEKVRNGLAKGLKENYYLSEREWPYKDIPRRIIAEQFLEDNVHSGNLLDYKFFCFNGIPKFCQVISRSDSLMTVDFFDTLWNHQPFHEPKEFPFALIQPACPPNLDKMLSLAEQLSKDIPFLRVDFYNINGCIYFGELTFYPTSGLGEFSPSKWGKIFGDMIDLSYIVK